MSRYERTLIISLLLICFCRVYTYITARSALHVAHRRWTTGYAAGGSSHGYHAQWVTCDRGSQRQQPPCLTNNVLSTSLGRRFSRVRSTSGQGDEEDQSAGRSSTLPESTSIGTESAVSDTGAAVSNSGLGAAPDEGVVRTGSSVDLSRGISFEAPKTKAEETEEVEEFKKVGLLASFPRLYSYHAGRAVPSEEARTRRLE